MGRPAVTWQNLELAEMISYVFMVGGWKSLQEVEDSITMGELVLITEAYNKKLDDDRRFAAALKGVKWGDENHGPEGEDDVFEETKRQAAAILAGKNKEDAQSHHQQSFGIEAGFDYEAD